MDERYGFLPKFSQSFFDDLNELIQKCDEKIDNINKKLNELDLLLETSINIIKNLQIVQNQILDNVKTNNSIIENNKILIEKLQTSQQLIQNDLKTNNNNDESKTLKIQNIETTIRNHNEDNFIQNLNIGKIS